MDGILLVDKPEGVTSAEVVRIVKRRWQVKTGHLGTLDPFASGVLPLCLGEGTKIAQFLNTADKDYAGRIRLGTETDSGDRTGRVVATGPVPRLAPDRLVEIARRFTGEAMQTPPMHSAIKHHGTPLYKLARQGVAVERQPRRIRIHRLELADPHDGTVAFSVSCTKGTYIRVLGQEIAIALGSIGHLEMLRRTRFGDFLVADAIPPDRLDPQCGAVIGLRDALKHLREFRVDAGAAQRARHGFVPLLRTIPLGRQNEAAKLIGPDGQLASVICMDQLRGWRFARVFTVDRHAP